MKGSKDKNDISRSSLAAKVKITPTLTHLTNVIVKFKCDLFLIIHDDGNVKEA